MGEPPLQSPHTIAETLLSPSAPEDLRNACGREATEFVECYKENRSTASKTCLRVQHSFSKCFAEYFCGDQMNDFDTCVMEAKQERLSTREAEKLCASQFAVVSKCLGMAIKTKLKPSPKKWT